MRRTPQPRLAQIIGVTLAAGFLTSCSTSTPSTPTNPGTGTLITIAQDVPICNAISANVVVEDLSFNQVGTGVNIGYITTTPSFAPEIRLNLQQLRDFTTILYEFPVRAGNYNQANLSFELTQVSAYDLTLNPPIRNLNASLTNAKPSFAINPPLVITAGKANVMILDFDVLRMLLTDAAGNLTGRVTPSVNITQLSGLTPAGTVNPNGFTELDDLWGFVRSVSTTNTTSNASFIGSFQMQLLSPSTADAPEVPINLTANTNSIGFAGLNHLLPNSYVEVDAILDSQGNLVAKTIEVQAVENPFPTQSGITPSTALIGPIVSIKTDATGNPSQLNLWVRDAEPDDTSTLLMDSIFQVDLTANPTYQASVMGPNFANLSFNSGNLAVGQEVVVHGAYSKPPTVAGATVTQPFTVEPTAIFLKMQSMQGTMGSMLTVGSDNETGVFTLNPCCTLLQGVPLYVVTNNQTAYVNVAGLSGITTLNSLLVKGMPYYEPQAVTINGVTIPGGTMVMQARQVHVLQ